MITGSIALLIIGLFRFSIHYSALVGFRFLDICPFHLGYTVLHVQFILLPYGVYFCYVPSFISDFSLFESFLFFLVLAKGLSFVYLFKLVAPRFVDLFYHSFCLYFMYPCSFCL